MAKLLDRLLEGSHAYSVTQEKDGYSLVVRLGHVDEFSDLVREAAYHAGDDFVVFTTSDGDQGYSRMFVIPLDETATQSL